MLRIREMRERSGWTQAELARQVGRSMHTVFRWEKGIRLPDAEELRILAKVLNCSLDDLVCDAPAGNVPAARRGGDSPDAPSEG